MEIYQCDSMQAKKTLEVLRQKKINTKEMYAHIQNKIGDRILVDKTPSYSIDAQILHRAEDEFDEPYYIHLLRHPYAMIYSFIEAKLDQYFFKYKHNFQRAELAELIWYVSNKNILEFFKNIPDHRYYTLKFEELVTNPSPEVHKICNFLDIEFQEDMLHPYVGDKMTTGIDSNSQMVGDYKFYLKNKIESSVADRWKTIHKSDFLSDKSKELAKKLGYETVQLIVYK